MSDKQCSIEGCEKPSDRRGWCRTHYNRWHRHGDPNVLLRPAKIIGGSCSVDGCEDGVRSLGLCAAHYQADWGRQHPDRIHEQRARSEAKHHEARKAKSMRMYNNLRRETLEVATRRGAEWASWEMEMVADSERSIKDLALVLGRTYGAVSLMRHKIRYDPQTIARVDLSSDGTL